MFQQFIDVSTTLSGRGARWPHVNAVLVELEGSYGKRVNADLVELEGSLGPPNTLN